MITLPRDDLKKKEILQKIAKKFEGKGFSDSEDDLKKLGNEIDKLSEIRFKMIPYQEGKKDDITNGFEKAAKANKIDWDLFSATYNEVLNELKTISEEHPVIPKKSTLIFEISGEEGNIIHQINDKEYTVKTDRDFVKPYLRWWYHIDINNKKDQPGKLLKKVITKKAEEQDIDYYTAGQY